MSNQPIVFRILNVIVKNAVYLQNHVSCPVPMDTSCIWPQMRPWSSFALDVLRVWNELPDAVLALCSIACFRKKLKHYHFSKHIQHSLLINRASLWF